jgi:hypothetical protein
MLDINNEKSYKMTRTFSRKAKNDNSDLTMSVGVKSLLNSCKQQTQPVVKKIVMKEDVHNFSRRNTSDFGDTKARIEVLEIQTLKDLVENYSPNAANENSNLQSAPELTSRGDPSVKKGGSELKTVKILKSFKASPPPRVDCR